MESARYGFRIVGSCRENRRLVEAATAFSGYAACAEQAEVTREAYLSAFQFGDAFRRQLEMTGSTRGYKGPCWSPWLWWDIDRVDDIDAATRDARRLAVDLANRYELDGDELLIFYSGFKGFHVGLPTSLWQPQQSAVFNKVARCFAENVAESLGVEIDTGVYDKVRAFRAPNSRHTETGRHKRRLTFDELIHVKTAAILERASEPEPFDLPDPPPRDDQAAADWRAAGEHVERKTTAFRQRRLALNGSPTLNRRTVEFIRDGAQVGDRHRLLFSAAANLAEYGCPPALAHALLTESALDAGLAPRDVRRQIECGLASVSDGSTRQNVPESPQAIGSDSVEQQGRKRDTGDSQRFERQSCQEVTGAT
jgi:hypothetical protein